MKPPLYATFPVLADDEDEEGGGHQEADVHGRASGLAQRVGPVHAVGLVGLAHAVAPHLLVQVGRQLHLHVAVVPLHVLGEVEARVRAWLPIELRGGHRGGQTPPYFPDEVNSLRLCTVNE